MSEFLQSYGELSENLLAAPLRSSTPGMGCPADTSDCSTDTCPSDIICANDCNDCSDCSDAPITYPYLSSDGSDSSSIAWTVHHGTQTTYNYFRTIVKRGTTTVEDSGWGYADADYFVAIAGLSSSTTYTIYLYYSTSGSGTGISGGSIDIRTDDSPAPPIYTLYATVNFDANGGSVSPNSAHGETYAQPNPYGDVLIVFPTPTRNGYTFLYWLLDGYATHWPAGVNSVYATASGITYTARAQWGRVGTGFQIDNGSGWVNTVPYIDNGSGWDKYVSQLDHDGSWESA